MSQEVINPATGRKIRQYDSHRPEDVPAMIEAVDAAQRAWRRVSFKDRAAKMRKAADVLKKNAASYARLMAEEMGKPVKQGISEAEKCAWVCEYYAENAAKFLAPEKVKTDASSSYVAFEPIGILLAIMPWNFPMWQVFRAAAPALMAGNAVLLKHASNVPGSALEIEKVFREAGFAENLFKTLLVGTKDVGMLIEHPRVRAVTLTGSVPAGRAVAAKAGAMLKKTVLELGGSDPYIVLEDADLKAASEACSASRMINTGQSCIAAKRFIVVEKVADEFERLIVERMKAHKMGDPTDETVTVGPMARKDLRDELHAQVEKSIAKGAKLLLGGKVDRPETAFYPPTVLSSVKKGMPAYDDETFGPVASIIRVADEAEAVRVANDSVFGLGGAVFTQDKVRGERMARFEIDSGSVFVNAFVKSDPRLPFGGVKESGYGRELGIFGIREFVNIKTVYVR